MTTLEPIERRKLSDDVEQRILQLIKSQNLKPGDTLPSERQLMTDYGVGRPAIREAMQALKRMGVVEIRHGERPRLAEPSFDAVAEQLQETMRHLLAHSEPTMNHMKDARAVFEAQMARFAAEKCTDADVDKLKLILKEQSTAKKDTARFVALDGDFHRSIASISGNPIFATLSHAIFGWLSEFRGDLVHKRGREGLTLKEHRGILDAIENRDGDTAARLMTDHVNRANKLYQQA